MKKKELTSWTKKRKIGSKKITRSISPAVVKNLEQSWWFSQAIGLDLNIMVTIKCHDIDGLDPENRITRKNKILNKIAQFARYPDRRFETAYIWSRESRRDGTEEHLHVLVHIPPDLQANFTKLVSGWYPEAGEVDVRRADYRIRWTPRGKKRNAVRYLLKNSPKAAYGTDREYRKGGPILGKRCGCSRNIDVKALETWNRERQRLDQAWKPPLPMSLGASEEAEAKAEET